jgi:hypothetical protein
MGEDRLLAIDIQTAAGGPLDPASVYPPRFAPRKAERCNRSRPGQVARDKDMDAHHHDARPSIEALKLRRMRVQNEISLSTDKEDLDALHEELCRLNRQIEEAEH